MDSDRFDAEMKERMDRLDETLKTRATLSEVGQEPDEIDWAAVYDRWEWLWKNPDGFEQADRTEDWMENEDVMLFEMGVLFGIDYEQAYPEGRNDEWPIPLDERPSVNNDD